MAEDHVIRAEQLCKIVRGKAMRRSGQIEPNSCRIGRLSQDRVAAPAAKRLDQTAEDDASRRSAAFQLAVYSRARCASGRRTIGRRMRSGRPPDIAS